MKERAQKTNNKNFKANILSNIIFFAFVCILSFLFVTYIGQRTTVSGSSMENTLYDGDNLMVDKLSYRFSEPKRYDIIIFPPKDKGDTLYIKRIIAKPGETIRIDMEGKIYINNVVLKEDYGNEIIKNPGIAIDPITLGDDEYFVLGDNRNNSADSRIAQVGLVHRKEIVGRAFIRIYPFNKIGILKHG